MTDRKRIKAEAQSQLMVGMQIALSRLAALAATDDGFGFEKHKAVYGEAIDQFRRLEKFLGYEPNSWTPGV
jgi:hypothetical protein